MMSSLEWREVPIGIDAQRWVTCEGCKEILIVVHSVTTAQRLLDVAELVASDLRVQVVFTTAPEVFRDGVEELLRGVQAVLIPWQQATNHQFDLAVAAGYEGIERIRAPLIVLPHGAGYNKFASRRLGGLAAERAPFGMEPQRLIHDGSVVPAAIVLAHRSDLGRLGRSCPDAVPVASVVGDPCHDRIVASLPLRQKYRQALETGDDQVLVVVASTWGKNSLFGQNPTLVRRMVAELPGDTHRVAALMHPNIWFGHGGWQVRSWLADAQRSGLLLVPPEADWTAVLAAADVVVGDHGSLPLYATVADLPILLACYPDSDVDPGSASAVLAATAPRLNTDEDLLGQLWRAVENYRPGQHAAIVERLTSEPGRFNRNMRRLMYRLLRLRQPATIPATQPAPLLRLAA